MAITMEDINAIKNELDERYVMQADCNDRQENINRKFANDDKRIEIVMHDFATIKKLMWTVATASIGSLVTALFELILK